MKLWDFAGIGDVKIDVEFLMTQFDLTYDVARLSGNDR